MDTQVLLLYKEALVGGVVRLILMGPRWGNAVRPCAGPQRCAPGCVQDNRKAAQERAIPAQILSWAHLSHLRPSFQDLKATVFKVLESAHDLWCHFSTSQTWHVWNSTHLSVFPLCCTCNTPVLSHWLCVLLFSLITSLLPPGCHPPGVQLEVHSGSPCWAFCLFQPVTPVAQPLFLAMLLCPHPSSAYIFQTRRACLPLP